MSLYTKEVQEMETSEGEYLGRRPVYIGDQKRELDVYQTSMGYVALVNQASNPGFVDVEEILEGPKKGAFRKK